MEVITRSPLALVRELLEDDRREGLEWTPEGFAQRVWLACRQTAGGRSWLQPIIDTYHAWADAYAGQPAGALEHWDPSLVAEEPGHRSDHVAV